MAKLDGEWECIEGEGKEIETHALGVWITYRVKIPGGWLVKTYNSHREGIGLTFVTDPNHEWK